MQTVQVEMGVVEIVLVTCYKCGVVFGINRTRYDHSRQYGSQFFCTNGDAAVFGETQVQKLTRELAQKDQQLAKAREQRDVAAEQRDAAERRVIAQKAVVTRLKNKAAKGECPCCGKLFADLHEHMKAEHPEFEQREEPVEEPQQ